jgi:hypothetical protein
VWTVNGADQFGYVRLLDAGNFSIWAPILNKGIVQADLPVLRSILPEEVLTYAAVIYGEVGDFRYPRNEWIAAAWVIRNRVSDSLQWPNNYHGVLTQSGQFNAYLGPKYRAAMNYMLGTNKYTNPGHLDTRAVLDCLEIAIGVYYNVVYTTDHSQRSLFFNSNGWNPGAPFQRWTPPSNWHHQHWFRR